MRRVSIGWQDYLLPPMHPEGWRFVGLFAVITLVLAVFVHPWLLVPGGMVTVWSFYFFRNPVRTVPDRPGLVVSPASGVVQMVGECDPPKELGMDGGPRQRISVFMSVFDVHVNRCPIGGTVAKIAYCPGKFVNATLDKASEHNERNAVLLDLGSSVPLGDTPEDSTLPAPRNAQLAFVQIAGLVARRIRCDIAEGQTVRTGETMGLIRFGSRLDIYLPPGTAPLVAPGQVAISGETVLADLTSDEPERPGVRL